MGDTGKGSSTNAISIQTSKTKDREDTSQKTEHLKKRKDPEPEDEIDALFSNAKRHKFSRLEGVVEPSSKPSASTLDESVLKAIKGAPRTDEKRTKSKKK